MSIVGGLPAPYQPVCRADRDRHLVIVGEEPVVLVELDVVE
jgi:hypothetical protein